MKVIQTRHAYVFAFPGIAPRLDKPALRGPDAGKLVPKHGVEDSRRTLVFLLPTVPILENSISQDKRGYPPVDQADEDIMGLLPVCIMGNDCPNLLRGEPIPIELIDVENWATKEFPPGLVERLVRSSAQENYREFIH